MSALLKTVRSQLKSAADPQKAPQMQAYMKSQMPYHGVPSPILKKICKEIYSDVSFKSQKEWQQEATYIWRNAKFREERYAALNLCGHKCSKEFQTPDAMKMYEEFIVTGAWWDYVDDIASHRVGHILRNFPAPMKRMMRTWSKCDDMWKRRTSIISQLGFKKETDLDLLYSCIQQSVGSKEFFLQKAIGWALREYAWVDPKEIKRFVKQNDAKLAPLSKREALKNIKT